MTDKPAAQKKGGMNEALKKTEALRLWDDHRIGVDALCKRLNTDKEKGLTDAQAAEALKVHGYNELKKKEEIPWYCAFAKELTGFFSLLLWFGSILCFIAYAIQSDKTAKDNLFLGSVLAGVTLATGIGSYYQSSKSAEMMAQFENFIPPMGSVIRNGRPTQVEARNMVPGDLVQLEGGKNIPCDVVIFKSNEMKVNNASLTGEPIEILMEPEEEPHEFIMEAHNVCFFGTQCTEGKGLGICIKTGDNTVIGSIANLASEAEVKETPLSNEIERFVHIISGIAFVLGIVFFCIALSRFTIIDCMVFAIGIIVANVPEGLLATVTVSLAVTATRMAEQMVLVKNLESVETLGSTSCICSDKTGTLTQNRMTVSHMFFNRRQIDASLNWQAHLKNQAQAKPDDKLIPGYDIEDPAFVELLKALVLGTATFFQYDPSDDDAKKLYARVKGIAVSSVTDLTDAENAEMKARLRVAEKQMPNIKRFCKGDASETGLVQFAESIMSLEPARQKYPTHKYTITDSKKEVDCAIPFSSDIKFNLFIRDMSADGENLSVYMKGAPERILSRCSKILVNGQEVDFDENLKAEVNQANSDFGKLGERVLAFAKYTLPSQPFDKETYQFDMKGWKNFGKPFTGSYADYANQPGAFPMHDLTLIGVVSLNDPPRPKVDLSVSKCRSAGIKVIMVTGDQPPTAAAIAEQVNIIKHPKSEFTKMVERGIPVDKAMADSTGIVIHGDTLAKKTLEDDELPDDDERKGAFLQEWIAKPEVVFARTTPSQKLLIVDACQKAGHVVAVTGDGVNDSPAIRKADIGIAMGSGSDVAKNAADMLLLDDNFSSIVQGVEEGRLIFDNLKKSIAYTLSSNIPEILPFICFIVFSVPLPLSTVLILLIDLGTDMIPAISFAYENAELDIMDRVPRSSKHDHLVNGKLISFAYLQIGVIQASAGIYTYFYIMNDFGIRPATLFNLQGIMAPMPGEGEVYDPNMPINTTTGWAYGNSKFNQQYWKQDGEKWVTADDIVQLGWDKTIHSKVDIRLFYSFRDAANEDYKSGGRSTESVRGPTAWTSCRWNPADENLPTLYRRSYISDGFPICYSTEALKMAQSGYLVSIVCVQWADLMICKTRNLSLSQQGMTNSFGNFGLFSETALVAFLCYVPGCNYVFQTRMIPFAHFAIPSFSFYVAIFFYDELRKIWLRGGMKRIDGRLKLEGWVVQNTYY